MNLDVPSNKEFSQLESEVNSMSNEVASLLADMNSMERRIDLLVSLLNEHLSPIDQRKLSNRGYL